MRQAGISKYRKVKKVTYWKESGKDLGILNKALFKYARIKNRYDPE